MSYHADENQEIEEAWFQKNSPWITVAVVVCLFAASFGVFTYLNLGFRQVHDIGGELTIEADLDTRIYLGDLLEESTQVSFTWNELFGDEKYKAKEVELPYPAGATPELMSGSGAKFLFSRQLGERIVTDSNQSDHVITVLNVSGNEYFVRRANSTLDHVIAVIIDWTPPDHPRRRFLLPIRVRKGQGGSTTYFFSAGFGGSSGSDHASLHLRFTAWGPPEEFANEIKTKGLWEPGGIR
jgi:hypothetical protein